MSNDDLNLTYWSNSWKWKDLAITKAVSDYFELLQSVNPSPRNYADAQKKCNIILSPETRQCSRVGCFRDWNYVAFILLVRVNADEQKK